MSNKRIPTCLGNLQFVQRKNGQSSCHLLDVTCFWLQSLTKSTLRFTSVIKRALITLIPIAIGSLDVTDTDKAKWVRETQPRYQRKSRRIVSLKQKCWEGPKYSHLVPVLRWPFRVSDPGGKSTLDASESGDAPGLIAGTSDFPHRLGSTNGTSCLPENWQGYGGDFKVTEVMMKKKSYYFSVMRFCGCVCCMPKFGIVRFPVLEI